MQLLTSQVISKSWTRDSRFHLNDPCTGSLLVLCGVQFYPYFCLLFVEFLATPCKYCVFIKSLKLSYIPCCVWYSGLVGHSHASVCAWVPTENREYSTVVVLIITTNLLFVVHLILGSQLTLFVRPPKPLLPHIPCVAWVSHVLLITYYIGVWEGGAISHLFLHLQYRINLSDHVLSLLPIKSYHSFQSELSSTSGLIVLFFRVLCNGPVREYHGLTMNMLQTDCTFLPQCHASIISTPDLKIIYPDWWFL